MTTENLLLIATGATIIVAIVIADRVIRRAITKYSQKLKMEKHGENILKLIARIVVSAAGLVALLSFFGVPTDWFIGVSALTGAAIGFASTQTVGNFLAGFYLMISRPFMVNDYVRIGDTEGEIREITINYTKIYSPTYNIIEIPNRRVLDSTILNYSYKKNIIDYSFPMGFPHLENMPNTDLIEHCIKPGIETFYSRYKDVLPRKPEVSMSKMDRLERSFLIRMFFPEGKIETFYNLQPELMQDIVDRWDARKAGKSAQ